MRLEIQEHRNCPSNYSAGRVGELGDMNSKEGKVRLVRCPKCEQILPEYTDIPVYKCGGCEAVLQAKGRTANKKSPHLLRRLIAEDNESIVFSNQVNTSAISSNQVMTSATHMDRAIGNETADSTEILCLNEGITDGVCSSDESGSLRRKELLCEIDRVTTNNVKLGKNRGNVSGIHLSDEIDSHRKETFSEINREREGTTGGDVTCSGSGGARSVNSFTGRSSKLADQIRSEEEVLSRSDESFTYEIDGDPGRTSGNNEVTSSISRGLRSVNFIERSLKSTSHIHSSEEVHSKVDESSTHDGKTPLKVSDWDHVSTITNMEKSHSTEALIDMKLSGELENLPESAQIRNAFSYYCNTRLQPFKRRSARSKNISDSARREERRTQRRNLFRESKNSTNSEEQQASTFELLNQKYGSDLSHDYQRKHERSQPSSAAFHAHGNNHLDSYNVFSFANDRMESGSKGASGLGEPSFRSHVAGICRSERPEDFHYGYLRKMERSRDQSTDFTAGRGQANGMAPVTSVVHEMLPSYCGDHLYHDGQMKRNHPPSRMYLSGPITYGREFDLSSRCSPRDLGFSMQFPPEIWCVNEFCRNCPRSFWNHQYTGNPSSFAEQFHAVSGQLHSVRLADQEIQMSHIKDMHKTLRRHCLPLAGGAPFILCYECCEVLRLPADFLLSKKGRHRVRCGACAKVLVFLIYGGIHVIPSILHPPNIAGHNNLVFASGGSQSLSHADCSPLANNVSQSGERVVPRSRCTWPKDGQSPRTSVEHAEFRQTKTSGKPENTRVPDTISTSRGDVEAEGTGSPLHKLMGYISPSEMINASRELQAA